MSVTAEVDVEKLPADPREVSEPVHLSKSLRRVALQVLYRELDELVDAEVLAHLAATKRERALTYRRQLSDEGLDVLVDIITRRHSVPTIGFWRRYAAA